MLQRKVRGTVFGERRCCVNSGWGNQCFLVITSRSGENRSGQGMDEGCWSPVFSTKASAWMLQYVPECWDTDTQELVQLPQILSENKAEPKGIACRVAFDDRTHGLWSLWNGGCVCIDSKTFDSPQCQLLLPPTPAARVPGPRPLSSLPALRRPSRPRCSQSMAAAVDSLQQAPR